MPALFDRIAEYIQTYRLVYAGSHVLVAVSGGPDSSVMLHALARLRERFDLHLTIGHFNHGVRGSAADADEAFVRDLAGGFGLTYIAGRPKAALRTSEDALRAARYAWLVEAALDIGATHVAVGHTRDDQVETLVLRLLRGTGLRGLRGMRPIRDLAPGSQVRLIRPLLNIARADIEAFLRDENIPVRTDETNRDTRRSRNRVRAEVLPALRHMDAAVDERLASLADQLASDEAFLQEAASTAAKAALCGKGFAWRTFDRAQLAALPDALLSRILRSAYRQLTGQAYAPDAGATQTVMRALQAAEIAGAVDWPNGVRARWTADRVTVARLPDGDLQPLSLAVPGETVWRPSSQRVTVRLMSPGSPGRQEGAAIVTCWEQAPKPLLVRGWRKGDVWHPSGKQGQESVAETLRRLGVPSDCRPAAPVLATTSGKVWWVVGARPPQEQEVHTRGQRLEVRVDATNAERSSV